MSTPPKTSAPPTKYLHCVASAASNGSYILDLASISSTYAVLATNSTESTQGNGILLYSLSPSGLTHTLSLPIPRGSSTSSMRVVDKFSGRPTLLSSHQKPGCIKVWDERSCAQPVLEIHTPKDRALMCFDVSPDGNTLAAGTDLQFDDASILYWDPRSYAQPLHIHSSTHSDDITALHFHPTSPHLLLSASSDGLLSTSNAREADEDEAVREVANWGCSIARAGWFVRDMDYSVWAASDMETFGLWTGDLDLCEDFGDIRQPSSSGRWKTDYLVNACDFSRAPGPCGASGLTLFVGANSGDVAFTSISDSLDALPRWIFKGILRGVHSDAVVRSVLWDEAKGVLLTGDETGRLAAWRPKNELIEDDVAMADEELSNATTSMKPFEDDVEMTDSVLSNAGAGMKRAREGDSDQETKRVRYGNR